jgi:hypothetical protein
LGVVSVATLVWILRCRLAVRLRCRGIWLKALGSGLRFGRRHSHEEGQDVVSEFAVGCYDKRGVGKSVGGICVTFSRSRRNVGFLHDGGWSRWTVSVVSGVVTLTSMYQFHLPSVAMMSMIVFLTAPSSCCPSNSGTSLSCIVWYPCWLIYFLNVHLMLSCRLVRCGPVLQVVPWCACVSSGCPHCVPLVWCWHGSLCVYRDTQAELEGDGVMDSGEALCGQSVGVDLCTVAWSIHVV